MSATNSDTYALIKTLSELPGPVGFETIVQDHIAGHWGGFAQEVRRTRVDNVLAKVGGSGERLMIVAHADEICWIVRSISDEGFLYIGPYYRDMTGRPTKNVIPLNQPAIVVTSNGLVPGVFATASGHVVSQTQRASPTWEWTDWFIDIGMTSKADVEALGIHPGSKVIWNPETRRLGEHLVTGKAMDDRVALTIATLAGERLAGRDDLRFEVWLASTIQEEVGIIGANSLVDELEIDRSISLDVGLTGDVPGVDPRMFPGKIGGGPIVVYNDFSVHYDWAFTEELAALARSSSIPVQESSFANYGSDGSQMIRRGVKSALVTYPTRYTHSPIETVDIRDVEWCVDLLVKYATTG
ncbi:MAG: M42 family peptidase [Thermomicrobiales bacterium]